MTRYILDNGLEKKEFLTQWVNGLEEYKKSLEPFTMEFAAETCGLSVDLLKQVARMIVEASGVCILWAMGITQHSMGSDASTAISNLLLVTGNYMRTGTGAYPLRGHNNVQGAGDHGAHPDLLPGYQSVQDPEVRARFEAAWNVKLPSKSCSINVRPFRVRCRWLDDADLIAMLIVAGFLRSTGTPYQAYYESTQLITFLLGPATVALAVLLFKNIEHLRGRLFRMFLVLTAGSVVSAASGIGLVLMCGGSRVVAFSMAPKAVTTPIAINVAQSAGGIPSLSAVLAICGGILVAVTIKWILSWIGIRDARTFGLAAGTIGSGIGAAHALSFCELAGAFGALGLAFNGLITPVIVQAIAHFWPVC